MKKCILIISALFYLSITSFVYSFPVPKNRHIINDYAHVIDSSQKADLARFAKGLWKATGVEFSVLTMKSIDGEPIDTFAVDVFNKWKLGKKARDNGILLVLVVNDRKHRIEVGYGLEEVLPDGLCGEILDKMVPFLKNGWYGKAVYLGSVHIMNQIARANNVSISQFPKVENISTKKNGGFTIGKLIRSIFILFLLIFSMGTRMGLFSFLLLGQTRGGYWSSGYRGGFGGSSGFGGFGGGGMSGGGGASGSW